MARSTMSLARYLKDAEENVREAAAEALNKSAEEVVKRVKENMEAQGIKTDSGKLRGSIKASKATENKLNVVIKSEVFKPAPRRPGWRNPRMKTRYRYGTPYGRIIEFSPRIKKPFFYKSWYEERKKVTEQIIESIRKAWSDG